MKVSTNAKKIMFKSGTTDSGGVSDSKDVLSILTFLRVKSNFMLSKNAILVKIVRHENITERKKK